MSDLAIGAHCALPCCNINDFLPIRCKCDQLFCRDHVAPEVHSCPVLTAKADVNVEDIEGKEKKKMQRCAKDGCGKLSLEAFVGTDGAEGRVAALCPRCQHAFCSSHRTPSAHACTAPDPATPAPRNETGKALVAKLFPAKDSSPSSSPSSPSISPPTTTSTTTQTIPAKRKAPTNPKKAAQLRQVELMKMRHRAQPGDPRDKTRHVPVEQRHHLKVSLQAEGGKSEEKLVWFLKDMGTGRALDLLAGQFGVSSDIAPLYLEYTPSEDPEEKVRLQNDKPLADQVPDGAQIVLIR